jgi:predicted permease
MVAMDAIIQDLRHAWRALARAPGFAIVASLSIAVGIAVNVAVFSLVNALLLRPLSVPESERLVRVGRTTRDATFATVSLPEYRDLQTSIPAVSDLIGHFPTNAVLTVGDEPRSIWFELVTANYFSGLRVQPALGRGFLPEDDRAPNASPVLVISHELWRSRFGGDPSVIGRSVRLNGRAFTVIGVAPPGYRGTFTGSNVDAWVPVMMQAVATPGTASLTDREGRFLMLIGRLRPGAELSRVKGDLAVAARRLTALQRDTTDRVRLQVASAAGVHPFIAGIVTAFLALLQGIVLLVLLIACANLANLLLVRTAGRRRDLAIRTALGASRARLARLLLAESVLLATVGSVVGIVLAWWLGRLVERWQPPVGIPIAISLAFDGRVMAAAVVLAFVTAIAFGAGPAWSAARGNALAELRVAGATSDRRGSRTRTILVAAQVAVATLLLAGSSLLTRSLVNGRSLDPGFDPSNIQIFAASPDLLGYDETRGRAMWNAVVERTARVPGVRAAALGLFVPLGSRGDRVQVASRSGSALELLPYNIVSPGYFRSLGIALLEGREFTSADNRGSPDAIVVSAAFSRRAFNTTHALGRTIRVADRSGRERLAQIVGVAADIKIGSLGEAARPFVYLPFGQWYRADMRLHVRLSGDLVATVVDEIRAVEPDLAVDVSPMTREMAFSLIPLRVAAGVLGTSGTVGLFLAMLGVFGLVAYAVSRRMREIGIRIALGARWGAVTRLVVLQGLRPVLIGLGVGLGLSLAAGRLVRSLLIGVGAIDPLTLVIVSVALVATALGAMMVPVRRALSVDPVVVLRSE